MNKIIFRISIMLWFIAFAPITFACGDGPCAAEDCSFDSTQDVKPRKRGIKRGASMFKPWSFAGVTRNKVTRSLKSSLLKSPDPMKFGAIIDLELFKKNFSESKNVDMDDSTGIIPAYTLPIYSTGAAPCFHIYFRGLDNNGKFIQTGLYHDSGVFRGDPSEGGLINFIDNFVANRKVRKIQILKAGGMSSIGQNSANSAEEVNREIATRLNFHGIEFEFGEQFIDPTGYPEKSNRLSEQEIDVVSEPFDELILEFAGVNIVIDSEGNAYINQDKQYASKIGATLGDFFISLNKAKDMEQVVTCLDELSVPQLIDLKAVIVYSNTLSEDQFKLFMEQVIWRNQPAEVCDDLLTGWQFVKNWIELKLIIPGIFNEYN